jgi:hypothetical protein
MIIMVELVRRKWYKYFRWGKKYNNERMAWYASTVEQLENRRWSLEGCDDWMVQGNWSRWGVVWWKEGSILLPFIILKQDIGRTCSKECRTELLDFETAIKLFWQSLLFWYLEDEAIQRSPVFDLVILKQNILSPRDVPPDIQLDFETIADLFGQTALLWYYLCEKSKSTSKRVWSVAS